MALGSPQAAAQKWSRNIGSAGASITDGVNRVSESPTAKAATPQAEQRYLSGVQEAVSSGKRAAALNRVSLGDWKAAMLNKGIPRIASGAAAAQGKMERFLSELYPHIEAGKAALQGVDDPRARMNQWFEHMSKFRRNR